MIREYTEVPSYRSNGSMAKISIAQAKSLETDSIVSKRKEAVI
jgi:activator of HSP90 ATPase